MQKIRLIIFIIIFSSNVQSQEQNAFQIEKLLNFYQTCEEKTDNLFEKLEYRWFWVMENYSSCGELHETIRQSSLIYNLQNRLSNVSKKFKFGHSCKKLSKQLKKEVDRRIKSYDKGGMRLCNAIHSEEIKSIANERAIIYTHIVNTPTKLYDNPIRMSEILDLQKFSAINIKFIFRIGNIKWAMITQGQNEDIRTGWVYLKNTSPIFK